MCFSLSIMSLVLLAAPWLIYRGLRALSDTPTTKPTPKFTNEDKPLYHSDEPPRHLKYRGSTYDISCHVCSFLTESHDDIATDFESFTAYSRVLPGGGNFPDTVYYCVYRKVVDNKVVDYIDYGSLGFESYGEIYARYATKPYWHPYLNPLENDDVFVIKS